MQERFLDPVALDAFYGNSPDAIMVERFDPPIQQPPAHIAPGTLPPYTKAAKLVYANDGFRTLLTTRGMQLPTDDTDTRLQEKLGNRLGNTFRDLWHLRPYQTINNMQVSQHLRWPNTEMPPLILSSTPISQNGLILGCWTRITDPSEVMQHDSQERRVLKQIDAFISTENAPLLCLAFSYPLGSQVTAGELATAYRTATISHITRSAAAMFGEDTKAFLHRSVNELNNPQIEHLIKTAFPFDISDQPLTLGDTPELIVELPGDDPRVYRVNPTFVFEQGHAVDAWLRIEDITNTELQARRQQTLEQTRALAMSAASLHQFELNWKTGQLHIEDRCLEEFDLAELPSDLAGWKHLLRNDKLNISNDQISDLLAGRAHELNFIVRLPNRRGAESHIEVWGLVNPSVNPGEPGHTIGLVRDVTDKAQLSARLSEKKTLEGLGVLAGGVAHDFNNLLMSVLGYAELMEADLLDVSMQDGPSLRQSALQNITEIRTAALRASELCTSLLAYAGQHLIEKKTLDLTELVRSTIELVEVTIGKRVPLLTDLDNEIRISADKSQLTQVIVNLVGNAADAMEGFDGAVQLSVTTLLLTKEEQLLVADQLEDPEERLACLTVRDNGCGMAEETLQRIYEPFFTTKSEGRGLGMAAVHGIVKHHGGVILVQSAEGKGTEFRVCLPLLARIPTSEQRAIEPPPPVAVAQPWVLVVDDEAGVRTIAAEMLRHLNCQVMEADSAESALALFAHQRFDYALLDITMPVMSGTELAEILLERVPDLQVVLCSGYTEKDVPEALLARCAFIHKPYTLKEVSDTLKLEAKMGDQAVPV